MMSMMTLTSLSVIMAVLVVNCYNGGELSRRAPLWARSLVLGSLSKLLRMSHDTDRLAARLQLVDAFFTVELVMYLKNYKCHSVTKTWYFIFHDNLKKNCQITVIFGPGRGP